MYIWLHTAIYTHIYSVYTPKWCARMTSQHNYSQETDAHYTKLTKLWCERHSTSMWRAAMPTQLLCHAVTEEDKHYYA